MSEKPVNTEVFVGTEDGKWPIHVYEHEEHAIAWWRQAERPHIWKAKLVYGDELVLMLPKPYLAPKT